MNQIKVAANPQLAIQNLITSNPQLRAMLQSGLTPQQIAQNLATQKGVDLNDLINQLNS